MRLAGVAALAYLLASGHPLGWLTGVPLRPLSLACTVVLGLLAFAFWPLDVARPPRVPGEDVGMVRHFARGSPWLGRAHAVRPYLLALVALVAAKVALALYAPAHGLPGWYYANGRFQGAPERSTEFPREAATRRDRHLDFGGDEFPVYFLNDSQRFNFFGAEAERRRNLPFSVRWQGTLYVPTDASYRFWLTASGPGTLAVDGRQVVAVDADGSQTTVVDVPLGRGPHQLQVSYARRPPRSGQLIVEWELDGRRQVLGVPYLFAAPLDAAAWERDRLAGFVARALDGLFLLLLAGAAAWLLLSRLTRLARTVDRRWVLFERPLLALFLLTLLAHATLPRLDRVDKMALLGGGQDWLTHETLARDILLNGPLMTLDKPLGEGRTFYAQPFYPYALAAMHWLVGEDQFGLIVLQLLGLGVSGVLLYFLAKRLFGLPAAVATFALFVGLRHWQLDWVARRLLSENVYFVILPAAMLCLVRFVDERRRRDLWLGGALLGLAVVTRGSTLLYLPIVVLVIWLVVRRDGAPPRQAGAAVAILLAACLVVVALVPLRNLVVAGQPALVASSGGVNLEKLHRPTPKVRLAEATRRWYAPYIQDAPTREVLEFVQQDPIGYLATYVPLALYTLGYGAAIDESTIAVWPDLVLLNLLYLSAIVGSHRARGTRALLLHGFIATHFLAMVVFAPYDYDNRLVLPMYLPIVVFAGFAVANALGWLGSRWQRGGAEVATEPSVAVHGGRAR